ncbi:hypothetical protein Tco_0069252 [Tanacetum coccineum]
MSSWHLKMLDCPSLKPISNDNKPDESQVNEPEVEQEEDNPRETNSSTYPQPDPLASIATEQEDDGEVMFIEIIRDDDEPQNEDPN